MSVSLTRGGVRTVNLDEESALDPPCSNSAVNRSIFSILRERERERERVKILLIYFLPSLFFHF